MQDKLFYLVIIIKMPRYQDSIKVDKLCRHSIVPVSFRVEKCNLAKEHLRSEISGSHGGECENHISRILHHVVP
jgi:hypothetical protein